MTPTKEGKKKKTFKCQESDLLGSCDLKDDACIWFKNVEKFCNKNLLAILKTHTNAHTHTQSSYDTLGQEGPFQSKQVPTIKPRADHNMLKKISKTSKISLDCLQLAHCQPLHNQWLTTKVYSNVCVCKRNLKASLIRPNRM